jgi:hypothetical protein
LISITHRALLRSFPLSRSSQRPANAESVFMPLDPLLLRSFASLRPYFSVLFSAPFAYSAFVFAPQQGEGDDELREKGSKKSAANKSSRTFRDSESRENGKRRIGDEKGRLEET